MAAALFQLPAVLPSASAGSGLGGRTLLCGAGSDHTIQDNNGRKDFIWFFFVRILTDLWDEAEEMMLRVLCIASP